MATQPTTQPRPRPADVFAQLERLQEAVDATSWQNLVKLLDEAGPDGSVTVSRFRDEFVMLVDKKAPPNAGE